MPALRERHETGVAMVLWEVEEGEVSLEEVEERLTEDAETVTTIDVILLLVIPLCIGISYVIIYQVSRTQLLHTMREVSAVFICVFRGSFERVSD